VRTGVRAYRRHPLSFRGPLRKSAARWERFRIGIVISAAGLGYAVLYRRRKRRKRSLSPREERSVTRFLLGGERAGNFLLEASQESERASRGSPRDSAMRGVSRVKEIPDDGNSWR